MAHGIMKISVQRKKKRYRDSQRVCSPYALTWNDERYYLIAYVVLSSME